MPIDKDSELVAWMAGNFLRVFGHKLQEAGLPAIRVVADGREWTAGAGDPADSVEAPSTFELVRATSGRRSLDQIRTWTWSTDPDLYLPHLSVFEPRQDPLTE